MNSDKVMSRRDVSATQAKAMSYGGRRATGLNALAWLVYGIGLIAPLTPSEGIPGLPELAIFSVAPAALLFFLAARVRSVMAKAFMVVQASGMVAVTTWLLAVQLGML